MAIPFTVKDRFKYRLDTELNALDAHFAARGVPVSANGKLLLASWNIANLGVQERTENDLQVIAHILKRFDLIAVQEVNRSFHRFTDMLAYMGENFDFVMTDTAGNDERLAFVYRKNKVQPRNLFAELAFREHQFKTLDVEIRYTKRGKPAAVLYTDVRFKPFDRNPFMGSFKCGNIDFTLVNVHLYYGAAKNHASSKDRIKYARRVMEIHALSKWASDRVKDPACTYDTDIVLMGDMNIPEMDPVLDTAYEMLTKFNFNPVPHSGKVGGSNLNGTKNYDQVVFAPGDVHRRILTHGIFDMDTALLSGLHKKLIKQHSKTKATSLFASHMKAYFSDHRPIWVQLDTA